MKKNCPCALSAGLSVGVLWGLMLFLWTLAAAANGFGASTLNLIAEVYPYYELSTAGAFWGLLWGFLDGLVGAFLIVWLYGIFNAKLSGKKK